MGVRAEVRAVVGRLGRRRAGRTEADVQADIRQLLLTADLGLDDHDLLEPKLEAQVGSGRRIDIELGSSVIEVKKDLRGGNVREKAVLQLTDYVALRSEELGVRFVGILTDGVLWELYHLAAGSRSLELVTEFELSAGAADADGLCDWLEGVLATAEHVTPTPTEVANRLGATSSAHALDFADLSTLYDTHQNVPSVRMKRELWARLLTTAFGTNFRDDADLFVEHTLLVVTAELIAHAVVGIDPSDDQTTAAELLSGRRFADASIGGVVEADFFDWVVEVPGGERFVRTLAKRLRRFAWAHVEHDVMKVLYESVIASEQRKKLGEYYTPDWLAQCVVESVVDQPLTQRVLDPACGSGTFVFHAVRRVLESADKAGRPNREAIELVTSLVSGVDIHPVAVTLARVTYLLAIGWDRLSDPERPGFSVPVYLGDSLQWGQEETLFDSDDLVVRTNDGAELFANELRFPRSLLADANRFDDLVSELAARASGPHQARSEKALAGVFSRFGVSDELRSQVRATFGVMVHLHDSGRNHIWGYYVRNLARPAWLTRSENRVDRLVGNPPWLAYRFMTPSMQSEFQYMTRERGLWSKNASVATHQDLSGLFVARSAQLYLRTGGRFGFVMPNAALTRRQFEGFRTGKFPSPGEPTDIAFSEPWDLEPIRPIFFPQSSCVVFGERAKYPSPLPTSSLRWSGRLPHPNPSWAEAEPHLESQLATTAAVHKSGDGSTSPYAPLFTQGASLVPRMLFVVKENTKVNALGVGGGRVAVTSRRSASEKPPWKQLPSQIGAVESRFVRPLHLGETVLPFRLAEPLMAIVPWDGVRLLDESSEDLGRYPGLEKWWLEANATWRRHRSSDRLTLMKQVNFRSKLSQQFPAATWRVVYTKSGIHLTAAILADTAAVIDHKLYWAPIHSESEGRYMEAVLNSEVLGALVAPLQGRGKDSPRDIDKYVWQLPIPLFDATDPLHERLAALAASAASAAATVDLRPGDFRRQRAQIRNHLSEIGISSRIDEAVTELLTLSSKSA